jgi:hypothetical protein
MITSLCLFTCVFAAGQPALAPASTLAPQLFSGLELVYSGSYTEENLVPNVQHQKTYRLDATMFVLESHPDHWDVAFLTALSLRAGRDAKANKATGEPSSVRLELAQIDRKGRLKGTSGVNLALPLDGPPTVETGAIVEFPGLAVTRERPWYIAEAGRPPQTWELAGSEHCNGSVCLKIVGRQQSDDWDRPRSDQTAWRRRDTLWIAPQLGVAYRVERIIERREPARRDPSYRLQVRYELDTRLRYPGDLFEYRASEIAKAMKFRADAALLWNQPAQHEGQIDALLKKIALHVQTRPEPTPYRKAVLSVQARLEKARRGETVADVPADEPAAPIPVVRVGQRAPDFVAADLIAKQSVRLYRQLGKPVLIVFVNPATLTGTQVLEFAQTIQEKYRPNLAIVAMAVTEDAALAVRRHAELKLSFSLLDGRGMHGTFGVEATPRLILLDGDGIVRGACTGWGFHVPREIENELQVWLPR